VPAVQPPAFQDFKSFANSEIKAFPKPVNPIGCIADSLWSVLIAPMDESNIPPLLILFTPKRSKMEQIT
jgi:hypothetical protein